MTTFLELQDELQFHIRQRSSLQTFVKNKLNEAVLDVMLLVQPPEFQSTLAITTSDGIASYDITPTASDNILAILGVSIDIASLPSQDRRLERGEFREFDETDPTDTGTPRKWFRFGNEIVLYNRVPDDNDGSDYALTVRMLERPTELVLDADVFPLQIEWEEPVVLRAASKMFTLLGNQERKQLTDSLFQESVGFVVEQTKNLENRSDRDATMRVGSHFYRPSTARSRR